MTKLTLAMMMVFLLALGARTAQAGEEPCFADWSVAAPIVKKEGLISVERLSDLVKSKLRAHIVKATLCGKDGAYLFQVVIRPENGKLRTLTLNARQPFDK
jgi:uncharacterized membrane protein YkoI